MYTCDLSFKNFEAETLKTKQDVLHLKIFLIKKKSLINKMVSAQKLIDLIVSIDT